MNERIHGLLARMAALERELLAELEAQRQSLSYRLAGRRVKFGSAVAKAHRQLRMGVGRWLLQSRPQSLLSLPLIYGMLAPLLLLDAAISLYQWLCFPLYGIAWVRRHDFIAIDHHHLAYLNAIEKLHCVYCGYANGLLAYAREIAARTEQYWCPIKHSRLLQGAHGRSPHFLEYGEVENFRAEIERLRAQLMAEKNSQS